MTSFIYGIKCQFCCCEKIKLEVTKNTHSTSYKLSCGNCMRVMFDIEVQYKDKEKGL